MFFKKKSTSIDSEIENEEEKIKKNFRVLETRGVFIPQTKKGGDWEGIPRNTVEYTLGSMSSMVDACSYETYEQANNRIEEYLTLRVEVIHPVQISPKFWRILKKEIV